MYHERLSEEVRHHLNLELRKEGKAGKTDSCDFDIKIPTH